MAKSIEFISSNYPDVLTVKDIQEALQIGKDGAYDLIRDPELRRVRLGRQYRVARRELNRLLTLITLRREREGEEA